MTTASQALPGTQLPARLCLACECRREIRAPTVREGCACKDVKRLRGRPLLTCGAMKQKPEAEPPVQCGPRQSLGPRIRSVMATYTTTAASCSRFTRRRYRHTLPT